MSSNKTDRHGNSLHPVPTTCGECGSSAEAVTGEQIDAGRRDLANKRFYLCRKCGAYVGCHAGTWQPYGTPALEHTRMMRRKAHGHFDPIWLAIQASQKHLPRDHPRRQVHARVRGYEWLSKQLGIPIERCHIGMMTADEARQVVDLCGPHLEKMNVRPTRQK
ncbi:zinc-finger-containing protein [Sphingomonas sp. 3-13AW]|uniref:zinc-finger-containing protein n=1 Tax=Sphingomonas sp. 3-13AW TaxID=3050450 RepID=UPI003BB4D2B4